MALPTNISWPGLTALVALLFARCYFTVRDANSNYIYRKLSSSADQNQHRSSYRRRRGSSQMWPSDRERDNKFSADDYESARPTPAIPNLDSYIKFYYNFSLVFNIHYAIKHLIIILLDFETFSDFRYVDCYLFGRLCLNSRVVGMANLFACFISSFHVMWALVLRFQRRKFQMPSVEFLLHREAEILYWDDREKRNQNPSRQFHRRNQDERAQSVCDNSTGLSGAHHSSLFHYSSSGKLDSRERSEVPIGLSNQWALARCKFSESIDRAGVCKHRPNRNLECWRKLCRSCNSITLLSIVVSTAFNLALWWWALPLILSKSGYELTYGNCVRYIADQKASRNGSVDLWIDHRIIFDPPGGSNYQSPERPLHFMSLLDDYQLIEMNWYQATLALVSFFELFIFYTELHTSFSSKAIITTIITSDVCNYCAEINRKLSQLIEDQRSLSILKETCLSGAADECVKKARSRQIERNVRRETAQLQAMIADLFALIDNYNRYASIQAVYLIVLWLCYSALVSGWMFLPLDNLPKAEWYAMHGFATFFLFVIIIPCAKVRRDCIQLHQKMCIAVALDKDYRGSKRFWLALLRFYMPKPIYCFTVQRDVEMSMLFALKLLAWLFTALSVASNFFIFGYTSRTM